MQCRVRFFFPLVFARHRGLSAPHTFISSSPLRSSSSQIYAIANEPKQNKQIPKNEALDRVFQLASLYICTVRGIGTDLIHLKCVAEQKSSAPTAYISVVQRALLRNRAITVRSYVLLIAVVVIKTTVVGMEARRVAAGAGFV